jgi:two-component system response regulator ResD
LRDRMSPDCKDLSQVRWRKMGLHRIMQNQVPSAAQLPGPASSPGAGARDARSPGPARPPGSVKGKSALVDESAISHVAREPRLTAMDGATDVLVVEDDPTVAEVVAAYFRRAGHRVRHVADGYHAVAAAEEKLPDLVVLDLMLPGLDGIEVHRRIREMGPVPVIMLTARGEESDRILGLETGADDYVTKPFSPRELVLRAQSVLSRARSGPGRAQPTTAVYRAADLELDVAARSATRGGVPLELTVREFDLLAFFMAHPARAFTREELLRRVWDWEHGDMSTVTVHVRRLREKIEDDPANPSSIATVWGVGYRFDAGSVSA